MQNQDELAHEWLLAMFDVWDHAVAPWKMPAGKNLLMVMRQVELLKKQLLTNKLPHWGNLTAVALSVFHLQITTTLPAHSQLVSMGGWLIRCVAEVADRRFKTATAAGVEFNKRAVELFSLMGEPAENVEAYYRRCIGEYNREVDRRHTAVDNVVLRAEGNADGS